MIAITPKARRRAKAEQAEREAAMKAYWDKRTPVYRKYQAAIDAEMKRYAAEIKPLKDKHKDNYMRIMDEEMRALKAIDEAEASQRVAKAMAQQ